MSIMPPKICDQAGSILGSNLGVLHSLTCVDFWLVPHYLAPGESFATTVSATLILFVICQMTVASMNAAEHVKCINDCSETIHMH
jgi:hypothetical protein